ncbi:PH and SEC7 domain-containing protein 3 [Bagarius yarrelli]|uniref:PH and SEC7 domain-containing protein 3 n=1 Tax=Bagarius yarrelli TaxID=175774 RepID=A0A556TY91_BAGYA|nr:PH and SEC7 domain-containing protein 3 [Bagarius yarrelli]
MEGDLIAFPEADNFHEEEPYLEAKLYIERVEQENNRCQEGNHRDRTQNLLTTDSSEPLEHGVSITMYPVRVPSMHFSCATVQWDMPQTSSDVTSRESDTSGINSSYGSNMDWAVNPPSLVMSLVNQEEIIDLVPDEEPPQMDDDLQHQTGIKVDSCQLHDEVNVCVTSSNADDQTSFTETTETLKANDDKLVDSDETEGPVNTEIPNIQLDPNVLEAFDKDTGKTENRLLLTEPEQGQEEVEEGNSENGISVVTMISCEEVCTTIPRSETNDPVLEVYSKSKEITDIIQESDSPQPEGPPELVCDAVESDETEESENVQLTLIAYNRMLENAEIFVNLQETVLEIQQEEVNCEDQIVNAVKVEPQEHKGQLIQQSECLDKNQESLLVEAPSESSKQALLLGEEPSELSKEEDSVGEGGLEGSNQEDSVGEGGLEGSNQEDSLGEGGLEGSNQEDSLGEGGLEGSNQEDSLGEEPLEGANQVVSPQEEPSQGNEFSRAVGEEYLKFFDFTGQSLDEALRSFLKEVVLIGETQERERVLDHFSRRFQQCNPETFSSTGAVLTLTCAVMLLNTDLHGQNVGKAMSLPVFVSNLDGMNEGENFSKDLLKALYNSIKNHPLEWAVEEKELLTSITLEQDSDQDASLRSKSNPFQDLAHDKKATVFQKGFLRRKAHADIDGKRTPWGKRSWKTFYAVLKGMVLYLQKDEYRKDWQSSEEVLSVHHALAERAQDYTKRPHVFRLQTADWRVFLFEAQSTEQMNSWIGRINLVSALYSSPPFPAAVGSQRKFCRPILPATQSALILEDLSALQQGVQESRKAKARELEENRQKEEYLQHERSRYEIYIHVLDIWQNLGKSSETVSGTDLSLFDQELWKGADAEEEEDSELDGGIKRSHSSPSLELEVATPPVVKVRRNISERRTYRKIVIPRRNREV